ncbi:hypothetical protein A4U49_04320 [Acidithiobacillus ferrivorans]|jgi:hypothetical protein|uniref:hypothetical protein n=1 Tax=Acidithiobacillus ferrivorans TaxID=160808 RepID=UPI0008940029|nr:hypothetical protein [Acidithiobacillus ferrivorans]OFA17012.1 hypothetical protein A4U49_04320 [Acidithiobacillus ferrivorans]
MANDASYMALEFRTQYGPNLTHEECAVYRVKMNEEMRKQIRFQFWVLIMCLVLGPLSFGFLWVIGAVMFFYWLKLKAKAPLIDQAWDIYERENVHG